MEEQRKVESEDNHQPKNVSSELELAATRGIMSTEGYTNSYTRLRKTSDTDEISLLFEDALEYQDEDINDILAELAANNDEGTLKGVQNREVKSTERRKLNTEEKLDLGFFKAERLDKKTVEEDRECEEEIMIDCPPYINMPLPMKKIGDIGMRPCEVEYQMTAIREVTGTISSLGCATVSHSPTYQKSAFDAYRRHRPQSFDGSTCTMEIQQVEIKMISRLQLNFY